jgi:hypothetical protein
MGDLTSATAPFLNGLDKALTHSIIVKINVNDQ